MEMCTLDNSKRISRVERELWNIPIKIIMKEILIKISVMGRVRSIIIVMKLLTLAVGIWIRNMEKDQYINKGK